MVCAQEKDVSMNSVNSSSSNKDENEEISSNNVEDSLNMDGWGQNTEELLNKEGSMSSRDNLSSAEVSNDDGTSKSANAEELSNKES